MNVAITSPSSFRSASRPEASSCAFKNLRRPASAKPELGPPIKPTRQSSRLFLKDSLVSTSTKLSAASRQGNAISPRPTSERTPGTALLAPQMTPTSVTFDVVRRKYRRAPTRVPAVPRPVAKDRELPLRLTPDLGGNPLFRRRRVRIILVLSRIEPASLVPEIARLGDAARLTGRAPHQSRLNAAEAKEIKLPGRYVPGHHGNHPINCEEAREDAQRERRVARRILDNRMHPIRSSAASASRSMLRAGSDLTLRSGSRYISLPKDPNVLLPERIQAIREFDERYRRIVGRIQKGLERVGTFEDARYASQARRFRRLVS